MQVGRQDGRRSHRKGPLLLLLLLLACWLFALAKLGQVASAEQRQQPQKLPQQQQQRQQLAVDLSNILAQQQALVEQCKRLEAARLAELRQAVELSRELGVELGRHLSIKLPAVCLMLAGPTKLGKRGDQMGPNERQQGDKLDMVNWFYDYDELVPQRGPPAGARNSTAARRRRASSTSMAPDKLAAENLLHDYWLDLDKLEADGQKAAPTGAEAERAKFREQMERMVADERFKAAIRQMDANSIEPHLSPVVLVPGLAGSRLQARVLADKPKANIICSRQPGWQDMWLTLRAFLPVAIDCWIDNVRMEPDPASGFTRNAPGVESRVAQFGSVESVRHLDLKSPKLSEYFASVIERYEQLGYQPDQNLFAAPYDFRVAPQQLAESFFNPLKKLIEFAYSNEANQKLAEGSLETMSLPPAGSGCKKVTLLCHSMGCTHMLIFLRNQTAAWRQSRIRKLIAISSPWGGSVKALKALLVGEQFGLPLVSEAKMRNLVRGFPGVAHMLPQEQIFGLPNKDEPDYDAQPLVETPQSQFKVNELERLLRAAGLERQWDWFNQSANLIRPLEPLADLRVDCLHSLNVPTTETIIFRNSSDFPNGNYELARGDGDGTVNHQSLLVCARWARLLPDRVRHKVVLNANHVGILSNKALLEHITDDVLGSD